MGIISQVKRRIQTLYARYKCHVDPVGYARSLGVRVGGGYTLLWNIA